MKVVLCDGRAVDNVRLVCTAKSNPPAPGDFKGRGYYRDYDVYIGDERIGTVSGGTQGGYSNRLGRQRVGVMVWHGRPAAGAGATHSRRDSVRDVVGYWMRRKDEATNGEKEEPT